MLRLLLLLSFGCTATSLPGEVVAYNGHPTRFATDGQQFYWLDNTADGSLVVYGAPLADAPLNRLDLAPLGPGGYRLEIDAANLYLGDSEGVFQLNRADTSIINIADAPPIDIVLTSDTIIWSNEGPGDVLHWRAKSGGPVTTIRMPEAVRSLVVDTDTVYVEAVQGVYAVSFPGGAVRQIAEANDYASLYFPEVEMFSHGLVKNGNRLEWLVHQIGEYADQDHGALIQIDPITLAASVLVQNLRGPGLLRADAAGRRYWIGSEGDTSLGVKGIRRLAPGETTPVEVLTNTGVFDFEIVGAELFWSYNDPDPLDYGYIRRMPLP